jgi:hypothetical protein
MVPALLTTQRRPSTFFVEDLSLWFFFVIRGEDTTAWAGDSLSNVSEYSDGFYRAGQRPLSIGVDFHPKARVNPSHFAEAASEGGSSKSGGSQLGEKLSASNQNFTARAVNNYDFVDTVRCFDGKPLHILHVVNLHAIRPRVIRPCIKDCPNRDVFFLFLLHWLPSHSDWMLGGASRFTRKQTQLERQSTGKA